jgi:heme exporter protein D
MLFTDFQDFLNTGNFNVLLKLTAFRTQIKNKIYQIVGIVQKTAVLLFEKNKSVNRFGNYYIDTATVNYTVKHR